MSASYFEAAPAPSLQDYSSSRNSSSRRRVHRPSSTSYTRDLNDARIVAPSTDLIHDLLASFDSISPPLNDSRKLHPALRAQTKQNPTSSRYRSPSPDDQHEARRIKPTQKSASPLTDEFARVQEDAAEPPAIRTGRSSISFARRTSSFLLSDNGSSAQLSRGNVSFDGRAEEGRNQPRSMYQEDNTQASEGSDDNSSYASTIKGLSNGRESYEYDFATSSRGSSHVTGKKKAAERLPARPARRDVYDSHSQQRLYITPSPPRTRQATARSSMSFNADTRPAIAGFNNYYNRFNSIDMAAKDRIDRVRPSEDSFSRSQPAAEVLIPKRSSSMKRKDSLTLVRGRNSATPSAAPVLNEQRRREDNKLSNTTTNESPPVTSRRTTQPEITVNGADENFSIPSSHVRPSQALRRGRSKTETTTEVSKPQISPYRPTAASERTNTLSSFASSRPSMDINMSDTSFAPPRISYSSRLSEDVSSIGSMNVFHDSYTNGRPPAATTAQSPKQSLDVRPSESRKKRWSTTQLGFNSIRAPAPNSGQRSSSRGRPSIQESIRSRSSTHEVLPLRRDSVPDAVASYLQSPRLSQKVVVPGDNRIVTFSEVGDRRGHPVICCIGMGMTRYIMAFYDELAISLKLRLITPDRPGIGGSEQYAEGMRQAINWPGMSLEISTSTCTNSR